MGGFSFNNTIKAAEDERFSHLHDPPRGVASTPVNTGEKNPATFIIDSYSLVTH